MPRRTRTFVREQICAGHGGEVTQAALLLTSDLVTQAVLRADGPLSIGVDCDGTVVALAVGCWIDASSAPPGRLLSEYILHTIVETICRTSGVESTEQGLTMWCTIAMTGTTAPSATGPEHQP